MPKQLKNTTRNFGPMRRVQLAFALGFVVVGGVIAYMAMAIPRSTGAASSNANSSANAQNRGIIFSSPHSYSKPVAQTQKVKMNAPVPDFSATDIEGKTLQLSDWKGQPTILFFADLSCPCVKAYEARMKNLQQEYSSQGLQVAYVFPDAKDSLKAIGALSKTNKYPWRSIRDADQKLMNLFNVQCTTEAFLIDGEGILRYHGRVDDSIFEPEKAKSHDLENALTSVLKNEPVKVAETQAYACTIPRLKKKANS